MEVPNIHLNKEKLILTQIKISIALEPFGENSQALYVKLLALKQNNFTLKKYILHFMC